MRLDYHRTNMAHEYPPPGNWPPKKQVAIEHLRKLSIPFLDQGHPSWTTEAAAFNLRVPARPALIVYAKTAEQVQDVVNSGVAAGLKVSARCGGHSYTSLGHGGENGHLVVDLTPINSIVVDQSTFIATVGAGARLGHVASELHKQGGRAIAHGSCPGVGVSGHILHGGYGWASHNKGLALDWMIGADVVLANGTQVHCSETENPDLFWALRGAGSSFGIVTSYQLRTFPVPDISTPFKVPLSWRSAQQKHDGLRSLVEFSRQTPAGLNMRLGAFDSGDHSFEGVYYGSVEDLRSILAPLLAKTGGELIAAPGTWLEGLEYYAERNSLAIPDPYKEHGNFYATSLTLKDLTGDSLRGFVGYWHSKAIGARPGSWFIQFDLHGGPTSAISAVPNSASAYAHRDKAFLIQFYHYIDNEIPYPTEGISLMKGWIKSTTRILKESDWGMYVNYIDSELDRDTAEMLYWGGNLQRLRDLKRRYDPTDVFYNPQDEKRRDDMKHLDPRFAVEQVGNVATDVALVISMPASSILAAS